MSESSVRWVDLSAHGFALRIAVNAEAVDAWRYVVVVPEQALGDDTQQALQRIGFSMTPSGLWAMPASGLRIGTLREAFPQARMGMIDAAALHGVAWPFEGPAVRRLVEGLGSSGEMAWGTAVVDAGAGDTIMGVIAAWNRVPGVKDAFAQPTGDAVLTSLVATLPRVPLGPADEGEGYVRGALPPLPALETADRALSRWQWFVSEWQALERRLSDEGERVEQVAALLGEIPAVVLAREVVATSQAALDGVFAEAQSRRAVFIETMAARLHAPQRVESVDADVGAVAAPAPGREWRAFEIAGETASVGMRHLVLRSGTLPHAASGAPVRASLVWEDSFTRPLGRMLAIADVDPAESPAGTDCVAVFATPDRAALQTMAIGVSPVADAEVLLFDARVMAWVEATWPSGEWRLATRTARDDHERRMNQIAAGYVVNERCVAATPVLSARALPFALEAVAVASSLPSWNAPVVRGAVVGEEAPREEDVSATGVDSRWWHRVAIDGHPTQPLTASSLWHLRRTEEGGFRVECLPERTVAYAGSSYAAAMDALMFEVYSVADTVDVDFDPHLMRQTKEGEAQRVRLRVPQTPARWAAMQIEASNAGVELAGVREAWCILESAVEAPSWRIVGQQQAGPMALTGRWQDDPSWEALPSLDNVFLPPEARVAAAATTEDALEAFEFAGRRIYPVRVRQEGIVNNAWAVETAENRARRLGGEPVIGGDRLGESRAQACEIATAMNAEDASDAERKARLAEAEAAVRAQGNARKAETAGKSLAEIRAADYLQGLVRSDGEVMTRADWVRARLSAGDRPRVEVEDRIKPMSRMAYFRATAAEQAAHERRIKEGGKIQTYWLGAYSAKKIEYEYAQSLSASEDGLAVRKVEEDAVTRAADRGTLPVLSEVAEETAAALEAAVAAVEDGGADATAAVHDDAQAEAETSPSTPAKKRPRASKAAADKSIGDFGEKIGGARKDLAARGTGLTVSAVAEWNDREMKTLVTRDAIWDFSAREKIAEGADPLAIWLVREIHQSIRTSAQATGRPRRSYAYDRAHTEDWMSSVQWFAQVFGKVRTTDDLDAALTRLFRASYEQTYNSYEHTYNGASYGADITEEAKPHLRALYTKESMHLRSFYANPMTGRAVYVASKGQYREGSWEQIERRMLKDAVFMRSVADVLPERFADAPEVAVARKNREAVQARREYTLSRRKEVEVRPQLQGLTRIGPPQHEGEVTVEDVAHTFRFRGGEWGNWQSQKDREQTLPIVFDALADLADVLGMPRGGIALNDRLAIAFGARGNGGRRAAVAHYEPARAVMNLTKMSGAGSLGHEFAHALDDYLGQILSPGSMAFASNLLWNNTDARHRGGMRRELAEAIHEVMQAILYADESAMAADLQPRLIAGVSAVLTEVARRAAGVLSEIERLPRPWRCEDALLRDSVAEIATVTTLALGRPLGQVNTAWEPEWLTRFDDATKVLRRVIDRAPDLAGYVTPLGETVVANRFDPLSAARLVLRGAPAEWSRLERVREGGRGQSVNSEYFQNAVQCDRDARTKRGARYWATAHELFARAFECYVFDRLRAQGRQSDYLVHGVEGDRYQQAPADWAVLRMFTHGFEGHNPYPAGIDRERIHVAFDRLIAELRHEVAPNGAVRLFSRRPDAGPGMRASTVESLVLPVRLALRGRLDVTVVQAVSDLPVPAPFDARGAYTPSPPTVWVVADNVGSVAEVEDTIAHEMHRHGGLWQVLGETRRAQVLTEIWATNPMVRRRCDQIAQAMMSEGVSIHRLDATEEALAALADEGALPHLQGFERLVQWVREALRAMGLPGVAGRWEDRDVAALMTRAAAALPPVPRWHDGLPQDVPVRTPEKAVATGFGMA